MAQTAPSGIQIPLSYRPRLWGAHPLTDGMERTAPFKNGSTPRATLTHGLQRAPRRPKKPNAVPVSEPVARSRRPAKHRDSHAFEQLTLRLLSGFGGAHWTQIDDQVKQGLEHIRKFARADRCELLAVGPGANEATVIYRVGPRVRDPVGAPIDYSTAAPWLYQQLVSCREPVAFSRQEELPPEAALDRQRLDATRTQAGVYIPYAVDGVVRYVLGLSSRQAKEWPAQLPQRLGELGRLFVTALATRAISAAHARIQEQLVAAQQFSQATLDALHEHVAVLDARGTVIKTSALWGSPDGGIGSQLTGVAVGSDYLQACESSLSSVHQQSVRLAWGIRSVLSGRARRFDADLMLQAPGGPQWIHTRVHRFEVGGATYAVISHEDVTDRRGREQELQQLRTHQWHSERVVQTGVIIASLAHELSQPVTAILANAQTSLRLLGREALDPAENRQILNDIVADCKRAGSVIESLRMTLRRQKTEHRPEDIADIVQHVIKLLRTELISQKVEVKTRYQPGCVAQVDRGQIQQVVLNLVMNAIEAMRPSPVRTRRVWASVTQPSDDEVRISIRDNGIGIMPEQLAKVFEAFWTTKPRGTGMGLSVSRAIVEAHGGRIWVKRNRVGSTFFVALHSGTRLPGTTGPSGYALTGYDAGQNAP